MLNLQFTTTGLVKQAWKDCLDFLDFLGDIMVRFHNGKQQLPNIKSKERPSGTVNTGKNEAFHKLCDHIDNDNHHQYSISDLISLLEQYSAEGECYTVKHLNVRGRLWEKD